MYMDRCCGRRDKPHHHHGRSPSATEAGRAGGDDYDYDSDEDEEEREVEMVPRQAKNSRKGGKSKNKKAAPSAV